VSSAFVGVGANLGDPLAQVRWALRELGALGAVWPSSLYRTEPLGDPDQPWFINAVARIETRLPPLELLLELKQLERRAGRPLEHSRWAPRLLDLDLLLVGGQILDAPGLRLPHPAFHLRRFVLEPLAEISPELEDPRTGICVREILRTLNDPLRVVRLAADGSAEGAERSDTPPHVQ